MTYRLKIISVSPASIKAGHLPKYTIMVFPDKGSAIPQTPELIEELNEYLQTYPIKIKIPEEYKS